MWPVKLTVWKPTALPCVIAKLQLVHQCPIDPKKLLHAEGYLPTTDHWISNLEQHQSKTAPMLTM